MRLALLLPPVLLLCSCNVDLGHSSGPPQTEAVSVELGRAEMARIELRMKVGELRLDKGESKLIEGDLRYRDPEKPTVRTDSCSFRPTVFIERASGGHTSSRGASYAWNLRLNPDTPLDLLVHFGVGEAKLNLGDL